LNAVSKVLNSATVDDGATRSCKPSCLEGRSCAN
jgi:hypothetical protein